jgi:hypothetical protein
MEAGGAMGWKVLGKVDSGSLNWNSKYSVRKCFVDDSTDKRRRSYERKRGYFKGGPMIDQMT